jgi:hypothetical protein
MAGQSSRRANLLAHPAALATVDSSDRGGSIMSQKSGWSLLLALSVAMLGAGAARADLGPFPHPRPRPEPQPNYCTTTLVRSVERATVEGGSVPRLVVRGTAPTGGWRGAALRFRGIERGSGPAVAVYELTGCRPVIATQALSPIVTEMNLRIATRGSLVRRILIKAETNSTLVDLDARPGH